MSLRLSSKLTTTLLPLHTFFGLLDIKLGSEILTYFSILNKVAGVYGLLAVFFGGNLAQVSLYVYSLASIAVSVWGLRQLGQEHPDKVLAYAHIYLADHIVSTLYTVYFGVNWYVYTPHDGRRVANSEAQKEILEGHAAAGGPGNHATVEDSQERARQALAVWRDERAFSTFVLLAGWLLKIYFILVLYSFALHLRRGTFRTLLASQQAGKHGPSRRPSQANGYSYSHLRSTSAATTGAEGRDSGDVVWDQDEEDYRNEQSVEARRVSAPDPSWPKNEQIVRRGSERQ
ncbi:hypothetical protein EMMF5_000781 [Cystobasidiomycetes sp. EMM_F5]